MDEREFAKAVTWVTRLAESYGNMCGEGLVRAADPYGLLAALPELHRAEIGALAHDHVRAFARIVLEGLRRGDHLHQPEARGPS